MRHYSAALPIAYVGLRILVVLNIVYALAISGLLTFTFINPDWMARAIAVPAGVDQPNIMAGLRWIAGLGILATPLNHLIFTRLLAMVDTVRAGDPFLAQRDRSTLLPDKAHQRALWRPAGSPGLVLMTGRPVGIWRARQAGARLRVTVEPFGDLNPRKRQAIEQAAAVVAPFRGRDDVEVTFA